MSTLDYSNVVTYSYVVNNVQGVAQTGLSGIWKLFQGVDSEVAIPHSYGAITEIGLGLYKSSIDWNSIKTNVSGMHSGEDIVGLIDWGNRATATLTVNTTTSANLNNETIAIVAPNDTDGNATTTKTYQFSDTIAMTAQKAVSDLTLKVVTLNLLEAGTVTLVDAANTSKTYVFKESFAPVAEGSGGNIAFPVSSANDIAAFNDGYVTLTDTAGTAKNYKFSNATAATASASTANIRVLANNFNAGETFTLTSTDNTAKTYEMVYGSSYSAGDLKGSNYVVPYSGLTNKQIAANMKAAITAGHGDKITSATTTRALASFNLSGIPDADSELTLVNSSNVSKTYQVLSETASAMVVADPSNYFSQTHQGFLGFSGAKTEFQITDLPVVGDTVQLTDTAGTTKTYEIGGNASAEFTFSGSALEGSVISLISTEGDYGETYGGATLTFTGSATVGEKITLISSDGTKKTYTAASGATIANGEFSAAVSAALTATSLKNAIDHANGHTASRITVSDNGSGVLSLTQAATGAVANYGNTPITHNIANMTAPVAFVNGFSPRTDYIATSSLAPNGSGGAFTKFKLDSAFTHNAEIVIESLAGEKETFIAKTNGTNGNDIKSEATITFTGNPNINETITIISTDGTSKTYSAKTSENSSAGTFDANNGPTVSGNTLKAAIEHTNNHGGKITVAHDGNGGLTLTQVVSGMAGNTTITSGLANTTVNNFTGGGVEFNKGSSALLASQNLQATINGADKVSTTVYNNNETLPTLTFVQDFNGPRGNTVVTINNTFSSAVNGGSVANFANGEYHKFRIQPAAASQALSLVEAVNALDTNSSTITASNPSGGQVVLTQDFGSAGNTTITTSGNFENSTSVNPPATFTGGAANGAALPNGNIAIHKANTVGMMGDMMEVGILGSAGHNGTIRFETDASNNVLMFQSQPGAAGSTSITKTGNWGWATLGTAFSESVENRVYIARRSTTGDQITTLKNAINSTVGHGSTFVVTQQNANAFVIRQSEYNDAGKTTISSTGTFTSAAPSAFTESDNENWQVKLTQATTGADGDTSITHTNGMDDGLKTELDESFSGGKYATGKVLNTYVLVGIHGITTASDLRAQFKAALVGSTGHNATIAAVDAGTSPLRLDLTQAVGGTAGDKSIAISGVNHLHLTKANFSGGVDPTGTLDNGNIVIGTKGLTTKDTIAEEIRKAIVHANGHNGTIAATLDTSGSNPIVKLVQGTAGTAGNKTNSTTLINSRLTVDNFTTGKDVNGSLVGSNVGVALYDASNAALDAVTEIRDALQGAIENTTNGHGSLIICTPNSSTGALALSMYNHGTAGNTSITTNVAGGDITIPAAFTGGATLNNNERYTHLHISNNDRSQHSNAAKIGEIHGWTQSINSAAGTDTAKLVAIQSSLDSLTTTTTSIKDTVDLLKEVETGKWEISNKKLTLYKSDKVTKIAEFDLFDKAGKRTDTAPFSRVPSS